MNRLFYTIDNLFSIVAGFPFRIAMVLFTKNRLQELYLQGHRIYPIWLIRHAVGYWPTPYFGRFFTICGQGHYHRMDSLMLKGVLTWHLRRFENPFQRMPENFRMCVEALVTEVDQCGWPEEEVSAPEVPQHA